MLENNVMRIILSIIAIVIMAVFVIGLVNLVGGGDGSWWSFQSWLNIKSSSAAI